MAFSTYPDNPSRLFPPVGDWSVITVECDPGQYSASRIARAVEDCDAHLLNLNVMTGAGPMQATSLELRVNHRNPESIARSIERYGYRVTAMSAGSEDGSDDEDEARRRAAEIIRYLDI